MDLSTTYLGLQLPHPFIAGASPLADNVDRARALREVEPHRLPGRAAGARAPAAPR